MRNLFVIIIATLLALCCIAAWADDGSYSEAGGGAASPMIPNSSVRMVRERIDIRLGRRGAVVKCVFVFKNEASACSVQMGFPERQWSDGEGSLRGGLQHFVSLIDGEKAEVKHRFPSHKRIRHDDQSDEYTSWYVKTVSFAAGQTRTVEDDYFSLYGISYSLGAIAEESFTYVLVTGATWRDRIGEIEINVDAAHLGNFRDINLPKGCAQVGSRQWKWIARNIKPKDDFKISLIPRTPTLNGGEMDDNVVYPSWTWTDDPHGVVTIPSGFIAAVGGEQVTDVKKRECTIKYGGHTLVMKEGTLIATLDSKAVKLPIRVEIPHENSYEGSVEESIVPLINVVQWLGGSVTTNKKSGRLNVLLKDRRTKEQLED
jgi:hypothetical protein